MEQVRELVDRLSSPRSGERRSAAKKLRKLKSPAAGPGLLSALEIEVRDPRTWETQYQMIMAIAESDHRTALSFFRELSSTPLENTMVYTALGDAIVRLSASGPNDAAPVLSLLRRETQSMLLDGAFRAMAMLRMVPDESVQDQIVGFVQAYPQEHHLRFWVAAAAAGWKSPVVTRFLEECARSPRADVREAATLALSGKYKRWNPL